MLKQQIIQHYLSSDDIVAIVPQHHGKALGLMLKYCIMAIAIWILYTLMVGFMSYDYVAGWVATIGLVAILVMFNYYFMMLYLDSVVITNQGVIIMDQVGLLDFSQTRFDRDSIQTISYHQHGIADRLLNKGDMIVGIEHGTNYVLPNVIQPTKRVDRLNTYKHQAVVQRAHDIAMMQEEVVNPGQQDKFELLVDKLSDIIVDYMKQPRNAEVIDGDAEIEPEDDYPDLYNN